MPTAIVTVAGKAAPEIGKKRGRIKDTAGIIYQADPTTLEGIIVGATYELTYRDDEFKGLKFRVVEKVGAGAPGGQQPSPIPHSSPFQGGIGGLEPRQAFQSPYPLDPSYTQQGPDYKSEEIACLAIIKCVSPLSVDAVEIAHALKTAAMGLRQFREWQRGKNIESGPRKTEVEFDDGIPEAFR